jgi:hypothetical protein
VARSCTRLADDRPPARYSPRIRFAPAEKTHRVAPPATTDAEGDRVAPRVFPPVYAVTLGSYGLTRALLESERGAPAWPARLT